MAEVMSISRHRMGTDGTGVRTLVGFYGCPLHCKYCINEGCHSPSITKADYTPEELLKVLSIDDPYFRMSGGGITFGGGEPLLQSEFIHEVCRKMDPHWSKNIETSLYADWSAIEPLLADIDLWFVDVKAVDPVVYQRYTGADNARVLENLGRLLRSVGKDKVCVRYPVIPGHTTEIDRIAGMAQLQDSIPVDIRFEEFCYLTC